MSSDSPFFSIIIPTYKREQLIGNTLKSVLAQTFTDFEVLVIDDGSKDSTNAVVAALNCSQIIYYEKENGERGAARNYGIVRAKGRYITFLDSDDILYPTHLEVAYRFLTSHQNVQCYAQAYEIKDTQTGNVLVSSTFVRETTVNQNITKGNLLSCFGVFVRKDVLSTLNFEEDRRFAGTEDWLLWLRLAARYPFYYNNEVTGAMLEHENRSVLSFNEESLVYRTNYLKKQLENDPNFVSRFGTSAIQRVYAHMLTYTSLHLAISRHKKKALYYWWKALRANMREVLSRRSLAIAKKILFV